MREKKESGMRIKGKKKSDLNMQSKKKGGPQAWDQQEVYQLQVWAVFK